MFNNKYELTKILGLLIISPCFLTGSLLIQEATRDIRYDRAIDWSSELSVIAGATILMLVGGLGLMLKLRWTRVLISLALLSIAGLWLLAVYQDLWRDGDERVIIIGMTTFMLLVCLGVTFLLYNQKITDELSGKVDQEDVFEDVLDI